MTEKAVNGGSSSQTTSIEVTTRPDRSLSTSIIYRILRPFGSQLVKLKEVFPAGSPRLTPPPAVKKSCSINERKVDDVWIYDLTLHEPDSSTHGRHARRHRIFYFAGGGWQAPPSPSHWKFLLALLKKLPDTVISLISYPLAPQSPAPTTYPHLLQLYDTLLSTAAKENEKVTMAGDSAGANIVLSIVLEALHLDSTARKPHSIMAICPSTDLTRSNPEIEKVAKHDPILRVPFIKSTAAAWSGEWNPSDRRLSPLNADIALLQKAGVIVDGTTAGYDLLGPDGVLLREKLNRHGVRGKWLHGSTMMHCWPIASTYGVFRESKEAFEWIVDVLRIRGEEGSDEDS